MVIRDWLPDVLVFLGAALSVAAVGLLFDWRVAMALVGLLLLVVGLALARRG